MVHAGCVFVAGIHPSRTWMSGSFESVQWNACVHRLDLGLYSHPKEFLWNEVRTQGKIPSRRLRGGSSPRRCIMQDSEPNTLGTQLFQPPLSFIFLHTFELIKMKFDMVLKQLSRTSWYHFWVKSMESRERTILTAVLLTVSKIVNVGLHSDAYESIWFNLDLVMLDRHHWTPHFDTISSHSDLVLASTSRSHNFKKAKNICANYLKWLSCIGTLSTDCF